MFSPKVIYNAKNEEWILWFNYIQGSFANSFYAVATSKSALGPFKIINEKVSSLAEENLGDFGLFIDEDETAYIIYTSHIQGPGAKHR